MGTRSTIGILNDDGTTESIYCHWDGYLDGVGKTLLRNYSDENKLRELLKLGSISSLGPEIGVEHDFNSCQSEMTTAYHRDRGDRLEKAKIHDSVDEFSKYREEFGYLFDPRKSVWIVEYNKDGREILTEEVIAAGENW